MSLDTRACLHAIDGHSSALAAVARDHLSAPVEHCPGWSVSDLVWHVSEVHWFWGTIVQERLSAPPDQSRRPQRPSEGELVDAFLAGAARLVRVLGETDQDAHAWTWAAGKQDVAFITRHQVQEAAVHHWDAAHAAGQASGAGGLIAPEVAEDSVEEFLTFSVRNEADVADEAASAGTEAAGSPVPDPLGGSFALRAADTGASWTLADGSAPSTVQVSFPAAPDVPAVSGTAEALLLWLYGRVELDTDAVPDALVERFRGLCFTD